MTQGGTSCSECGTALLPGSRFCGECGTPVPEGVTEAKPRPAATMLGIDAASVQAAAAAARAKIAEREAQGKNKDKDDDNASPASKASPVSKVSDARDVKPAPAPSPAGKAVGAVTEVKPLVADADLARPAPVPSPANLPFNQTKIEGELSPEALAAVIAAEETSRHSIPPVQLGNSSTTLGLAAPPLQMPMPLAPVPPAAALVPAAASASSGTAMGLGAPPPPAAPASSTPVGGQTSLGLGMASAPGTAAGPVVAFGAPSAKGMHGRTMLGVPLASMPPLPAAASAPGAASDADGDDSDMIGRRGPAAGAAAPSAATGRKAVEWDDDDDDKGSDSLAHYPNLRASQSGSSAPTSSAPPGASKSGGPSRGLLVGVLAGLALFALGAMVYVRFNARSSPSADVRAQIVASDAAAGTGTGTGASAGAESLQFIVPGALEGSKLRFGGQEQPLVAGHATFPLASDSLRVGDNVVLVDVINPAGETSSARIVLSVAYRLWVDTTGLRAARPSIDVKVSALAKTRVTLEGEDVALDEQGHATKNFPIDTSRATKGGVIDHLVHYQVQPATGEPVTDQLHTRIPVAMLQIDRPGAELVTDSDTVEIAGGVGRDTEVSIDGKQVLVKEGRFIQRLALPKPGDYKPRVTASAEGKAPFSITLSIRRVRDLAQAAREFSFDKTLTYAKIASDPSAYRTQPIAIEGRVYAVDARAGSSVIQMLARPCPSSQRCSLWVVDPQASDVAVDRWVRVLGTVEGEQQFRSESNQIVTVPKVVARFILPAKP